jgi:hypothetical protein
MEDTVDPGTLRALADADTALITHNVLRRGLGWGAISTTKFSTVDC